MIAVSKDHVGFERDQLRCISLEALTITGGPSIVEPGCGPVSPSKFSQPLAESPLLGDIPAPLGCMANGMKRPPRKTAPEVRRRALELLAAHPNGCTEAMIAVADFIKRWLQVRLGCLRLSPACPFRLLHTFDHQYGRTNPISTFRGKTRLRLGTSAKVEAERLRGLEIDD